MNSYWGSSPWGYLQIIHALDIIRSYEYFSILVLKTLVLGYPAFGKKPEWSYLAMVPTTVISWHNKIFQLLPAVTGTLSPLLHLGAESSHPVDSHLRGDDFITAFCGAGFTNLSLSHSLNQNLSPLIGKHQVHLPLIPISTSNSFFWRKNHDINDWTSVVFGTWGQWMERV